MTGWCRQFGYSFRESWALLLRVTMAFLLLTGYANAFATTWSNTNTPDSFHEYSFTTQATDTALRLSVAATGGVGSYLLLKYGAPLADNTDFDFASQLDGVDNQIDLGRKAYR